MVQGAFDGVGPWADRARLKRARGLDQVCLSDINEHWTGEVELHLCAVKDCWSNKIVRYSIDTRLRSELAAAALGSAIPLHAPAGTIVHSDRDSQSRSKKILRLLKSNHLRGSMGRVASSRDNAAMESFLSLPQKNVLNTRRWNTREELRLAMVVWIEKKYNRRRRQRALRKFTPVEFETICSAARPRNHPPPQCPANAAQARLPSSCVRTSRQANMLA